MSFVSYVDDELGSVIEEFGSSVLWWGVKNVDYLQPKLMEAAQGYSSRFDSQWVDRGRMILSGNMTNPLVEITHLAIHHSIEKHGIKKIEEIAEDTFKKLSKYTMKTMGIAAFTRELIAVCLQDIFDSIGVDSLISRAISGVSLGVASVGITLNELQFKAAFAYVWLAEHAPELCQKLVIEQIDTFFFLVLDKLKPFLEGKL